jgi:hypothetical protein
LGDIRVEAQGGSDSEDDVNGEEQTQNHALSSEDEDEDEGGEESDTSYSQKQIR